MDYLFVGFGGAFGAVVRYMLGLWVKGWSHGSFPLSTFIINITGSFFIGLITTLAIEKYVISPNARLTITVGFLGGYTTFSTFSYETVQLLLKNQISTAFIYVLASVMLGILAAWSGITIARNIVPGNGRQG